MQVHCQDSKDFFRDPQAVINFISVDQWSLSNIHRHCLYRLKCSSVRRLRLWSKVLSKFDCFWQFVQWHRNAFQINSLSFYNEIKWMCVHHIFPLLRVRERTDSSFISSRPKGFKPLIFVALEFNYFPPMFDSFSSSLHPGWNLQAFDGVETLWSSRANWKHKQARHR